MSYGDKSVTVSLPPGKPAKSEAMPVACGCNGIVHATKAKAASACKGTGNGAAATIETNCEVDFKKMTAAEKVAYHRARWNRILG